MIEILTDTNNFGDTRDGGLAGPTGLVIILFLVAGTIFLIRNMNTRLKRLPERFDNEITATPPAPASPPIQAPSDPVDTK